MSDGQVSELQRSMGRLEGKLDLLLSNMNAHLLEDTARFRIIDDRVSKIEKKIFTLGGAIAVVLGIFQVGIAYITSK
jgi:hypothetical protein